MNVLKLDPVHWRWASIWTWKIESHFGLKSGMLNLIDIKTLKTKLYLIFFRFLLHLQHNIITFFIIGINLI